MRVKFGLRLEWVWFVREGPSKIGVKSERRQHLNLRDTVKSGQLLLVIGAALIVVEALAGPALPEGVEPVLYFVALCLLLVGLVLWVKYKRQVDEALRLQRLRATRMAAIAGIVLLGGWLVIDAYLYDLIRWQIIVILAAMAGAKVGMMAYFQRHRSASLEEEPAGRREMRVPDDRA